MPKLVSIVILTVSSLTLTGCSIFYPNAGATSLPEEPQTSQSQTQSSDPVETEQSPSPEDSETSATTEQVAEETIRKETAVEIIMAVPEPSFGVLTVVAKLPGLSETGGSCTLRFISGSVEKTMEVKAEPSSDYTQCFPIELRLQGLPKGTGVVTVSYSSDKHFGSSKAQSVVIE